MNEAPKLLLLLLLLLVFAACHYPSAVCAVAVCLSVRLCVCHEIWDPHGHCRVHWKA